MAILKYVGAIFLFSIGLGQTLLYRRVRANWGRMPVVPATIAESHLINHNTLNEGERTYEASIKYQYSYSGKQYEANTPVLRSPQIYEDKNIEHELLAKYTVGDKVEVRVVPEQPKLAYIELGPFSRVSAIVIPILIVVYFVLVFGYGWLMAVIFGSTQPYT